MVRLCPWVIGLVACGCGASEEPAPPWLELVAEGAGEAPAAVERVRTVARLAGHEARLDRAPGHQLVAAPDGGPDVVRLRGRNASILEFPGPFDPSSFNQLVLRCEATKKLALTVRAHQGSADGALEVLTVGPVPVFREAAETLVDVSQTVTVDGPLDSVSVELAGKGGSCDVFAIELRAASLEEALGHPHDSGDVVGPGTRVAPRWVEIDGDERRAVPLLGSHPLTARRRVGPARRLEFFYGLPLQAQTRVADAQLVVELDAGGAPRVERFPLPGPGDADRAWQFVSLPLDLARDDTLDLRFSVHAEGEGPVGCALGVPALVGAPTDVPPVVFITSDTHRADHVGFSGSGVPVDTPTLDALAERGLVFPDTLAASNRTLPSHVTLMTGLPPSATGVVGNIGALGERAYTLAEAFHDAGYTCIASVSARFLGPNGGLGQGFERVSRPLVRQRQAHETIDPLGSWLTELRGRKLFVWLHLYDAHWPYLAADAGHESGPDARPDDEHDDDPGAGNDAIGPRQAVQARYRDEVDYVDEHIGRVLAHEALQGALVAVTADHGESMGEHDAWFDHLVLYPDVLRVPLVLAGPGVPSGASFAGGVSNVDVGRTLLDLSGLADAPFPGRNLVALAGAADTAPAVPRFAVGNERENASVELAGWLLILHLRRHRPLPDVPESLREKHRVELYDLRTDPGCEHDLVDTERERARRLRDLLVEHLAESSTSSLAAGGEHVTPELLDTLEGLGYAGGTEETGSQLFDPDCACEWCARLR